MLITGAVDTRLNAYRVFRPPLRADDDVVEVTHEC